MRRIGRIGFGLALGWALGCTAAPEFMCEANADCTLQGQPGRCTDNGNCAYPNDGCASGWAYPDGAPGSLSGACAEVEGTTTAVPASTSAPGSGSGSTSGPSVDGTTGDTSSDGGPGTTTEDGDTGLTGDGCVAERVLVQPDADGFFSRACGAVGCELFNAGASGRHAVGLNEGGGVSVMLLRFNLADLAPIRPQSVTLRLPIDEPEIAATAVEVWRSAGKAVPPWPEGTQNDTLAEAGESCWEFAAHPAEIWAADGLLGLFSDSIGIAELTADGDALEAELALPLDGAEETISLLVTVPNADEDTVTLYAKEGAVSPTLSIDGC